MKNNGNVKRMIALAMASALASGMISVNVLAMQPAEPGVTVTTNEDGSTTTVTVTATNGENGEKVNETEELLTYEVVEEPVVEAEETTEVTE